jgi:hypothetical protein
MKEYKKIQPEVIAGLGDDTIFLESEPPFRTVTYLHIALEDWLGDDLMKCHPCYIVTESLKKALEESKFEGFDFSEMKVTKAEGFGDYRKLKHLPEFYRMNITGTKSHGDFYVEDGPGLFVREELLAFLQRNFSVEYMDVTPERNEFDDLLDRMIAKRKG